MLPTKNLGKIQYEVNKCSAKKYLGSPKQRSLLTYNRELVADLYQDIIAEIHVEQIGMIIFSITMIKVLIVLVEVT